MSQLKLLRQKKFLPLFLTQCCGAFNDNFLKNALIILVTFHAQNIFGLSASQMVALASAVFVLPIFIFSALAGQIIDKFEKAKIIRTIKWCEVGIACFATLGFYTENYFVFMSVLFAFGLHATFFNPTKYSLLPQHLSLEEIVAGNAFIEAGTFVSILIGTISGGLIIATSQGPFFISLGLIFFAVVGVIFSYKIPTAPAPDPNLKLQFNPLAPTAEILKFAIKGKSVFISILGVSWFWFYTAALLSLFAPLSKEIFHGDESVVTSLLATFSIGLACGALLSEKLSKDRIDLKVVFAGNLGITLFGTLLFFLCHSFHNSIELHSVTKFITKDFGAYVLICLFLIALSGGIFIIPLNSLMQERSDPIHRARIISANSIFNAFFMVVSALLLVTLISFNFALPEIILAISIINIFFGIWLFVKLK